MRMSSSQRNLIVLLGVVFGVLFQIFAYPLLVRWWESRAEGGFAVSSEQMHRIADAVWQYEKADGERPMRLAELVETGMLDAGALPDERRDEPSENEADVLYFPALRASDPGNLVLLCTLLVRGEGEKFHVITNDGNYAEMPAHDLVMALNRTYKHLGSEIAQADTAIEATHADQSKKE